VIVLRWGKRFFLEKNSIMSLCHSRIFHVIFSLLYSFYFRLSCEMGSLFYGTLCDFLLMLFLSFQVYHKKGLIFFLMHQKNVKYKISFKDVLKIYVTKIKHLMHICLSDSFLKSYFFPLNKLICKVQAKLHKVKC